MKNGNLKKNDQRVKRWRPVLKEALWKCSFFYAFLTKSDEYAHIENIRTHIQIKPISTIGSETVIGGANYFDMPSSNAARFVTSP